jgi:two-component system nitrogen regulation response regulator NtrX
MSRHVLIADDDRSILASLGAELRERGYRVSTVTKGADAVRMLDDDPPDAILLDLFLGEENGLDILPKLSAAADVLPPVIMISGEGTISHAVEAVRLGAIDFVEKPLSGEGVAHRLRRALETRTLANAHASLEEHVRSTSGLIGESAAIRAVLDTIGLVGPTEAAVLVTGESGTGKELVARGIHEASARASGPFVAVNCSAIPQELVESELFGHQKGSFTGATRTRRGVFEAASGGTLFLDEIGDMPMSAQPKLLRTLEARTVQRVGAEGTLPVDVRIVAATHHDLSHTITEGKFREDLFHRLNVVEIQIPPLRERRDDLPVLCAHFLSTYAQQYGKESLAIADDALRLLGAQPFRGNVRELRNLMERLTILCRSTTITADDVRALGGLSVGSGSWEPPPLNDSEQALRDTLREVEKALIARTIDEQGGNMAGTARRLGLERSHLYKKIKELGVERDSG